MFVVVAVRNVFILQLIFRLWAINFIHELCWLVGLGTQPTPSEHQANNLMPHFSLTPLIKPCKLVLFSKAIPRKFHSLAHWYLLGKINKKHTIEMIPHWIHPANTQDLGARDHQILRGQEPFVCLFSARAHLFPPIIGMRIGLKEELPTEQNLAWTLPCS